MVRQLMIVDDGDDDESQRDESGVPRRERAEFIGGALRRRLVIALAMQRKLPKEIAAEFDLPRQTVYSFKHRHRREVQELARKLMEKQIDLFFGEQHKRIQHAEDHLLLIDDQIRRMTEAAEREEDPVPINTADLKALTSAANQIRKEIREELKPTIALGDIQITPPKRYGFDLAEAFEKPEREDT